jgi:hypothetical protein
MRFYVPPQIDNDFQSAVNSEIGTEFIVNFDSLNTVRAIVPELDYRAKQTGANGTKPLYAEIDKLKIGDYIQDSNNDTYIVSYLKDEKFPKCSKIQVQICNYKVTITRFQEEEIDMDGNITIPQGENPIVTDIYSVVIMGGYEFRTNGGGVGVVPSDSIAAQMQYNDSTKNIKISDTFMYFNAKYRIETIDYSQVDINGLGVITAFAKKVP